MYDPYFEAAVAEVRGFDLGDGDELLADLDARLAASEPLEGEQWLLRAILLYQRDRDEEALAALDEAIERSSAPGRALYIKSCVLRELERAGEALTALDEAREASSDGDGPEPAVLDHARGLLFWRVGSYDDALVHIDRALEVEPDAGVRWLHRGQLLAALGRLDDAAAAYDRALAQEQDLDRAMYERAIVEASRDQPEAAASWLRKAVRLRPSNRDRARGDVRFAGIRDRPALAGLLGAQPPADLGWLDALSAWMPALRRSAELGALELHWLSEDESRALHDAFVTEHEHGPVGTMHTGATLEYSQALLSTRRPIARGSMGQTRDRVEEAFVLWVDVDQPEQGLWLALSASYPPFLWLRIEPRADRVVRALREFVPRPSLTQLELRCCVRGFIGYRSRFVVPSPISRQLEPATMVELDRHFAISPFVEAGSWGSAFVDDPWPDEIPEQPALAHKIVARQQVVGRQAPGHQWSLTRRTRHSRSYLSIEVHHDEIFVIEARYRPSGHAEIIEAMNAHFGSEYPRDMPVDVVAALLGFQFDRADDLAPELDAEEPETIAGLLYVLSALRARDPGLVGLCRRMLEHDDGVVRGAVGDIAEAYNLEVLLEELSHRESDPELRAELEAVLDEGISEPDVDPYRVPEPGASASSGILPVVEGEPEPWELSSSDMVVDEVKS